jgi:CHAD domain-containing protein
MSYRLKSGEDAGRGVRRIAREQIDLASDQLTVGDVGDVGDGVHEARKAFKRLRALLRLSRDPLGDEVYRVENTTFRDLGRELSGVRDAAVLVETLDELRERYADELSHGAFDGLREALHAEARTAHDALEGDRGLTERATADLAAARDRVAGWPLPDHGDVAILAPGFRRIYRRGRKALRAAERDTSTESLHELRKRAKDLWHAAQVLRPAAPKKLKRLGRDAHALSDLVGDDHDLAVLLDAAAQRPGTLADGEHELLMALVRRRRTKLQRAALKCANRLYDSKPRKLTKRLLRGAPAR